MAPFSVSQRKLWEIPCILRIIFLFGGRVMFSLQILLKGGANPLQEDDWQLTPLETATIRRYR